MKTSASILLSLLLTLTLTAQEIRIFHRNKEVTNMEVTEKIKIDTFMSTTFILFNATNKYRKFNVTWIFRNSLPFDYNFLTMVDCLQLGPVQDTVYTFPDTFHINPFDSLSPYNGNCTGIEAIFYAQGNCKEQQITFIISDPVSTDSSRFILRYACPNGIRENEQATFSAPYPNPSSSVVSFNYSLPDYAHVATITLYDIFGRSVKALQTKNWEGCAVIPVNDLVPGLYLYSCTQNGKLLCNGKLVISD